MDPQFSLLGNEAPVGMADILADRQHSENETRRMSLRKIMLCFGVTISATLFRNRGNTPKGSNPHMYQDREADAGGQESGRQKNCT